MLKNPKRIPQIRKTLLFKPTTLMRVERHTLTNQLLSKKSHTAEKTYVFSTSVEKTPIRSTGQNNHRGHPSDFEKSVFLSEKQKG